MQRGGGVGGRHAVAGVAADGADVADLRAADHVDRLAEHVDVFPDDGVARDVGKARQRADADVSVLVDADAAHGVDAVDGDELRPGTLALAHLHEHVRAACDDLRLRMLQTQGDGLFHGMRLIERFHIIHGRFPPFRTGQPSRMRRRERAG